MEIYIRDLKLKSSALIKYFWLLVLGYEFNEYDRVLLRERQTLLMKE